MNAVDPWIESFQNIFTDLGAGIYIAWDSTWVKVSNSFNTFGALVQGAFDVTINSLLKTWDVLEAGVLKSWNYIQSFLKAGFDLEAENNKVDSDMTARERKRELERPGIEGRTKAADNKNAEADKALQTRVDAVGADAQAEKDKRKGRTDARRDERNAAASDAEGALAARTGGAKESRMDKGIAEALIESLSSAKSMDDLTNIGQSISALIDRDAISGDMVKKVQDAYNAAAKRIGVAADAGSGITGPKPGGGAGGGAGSTGPDLAAAAKSAEVTGTFSSNLGGMGFGSNLDQMQLDALNKIAKNTENKEEGAVAA
jgi:hypothetical protein